MTDQTDLAASLPSMNILGKLGLDYLISRLRPICLSSTPQQQKKLPKMSVVSGVKGETAQQAKSLVCISATRRGWTAFASCSARIEELA